MVATPDWMETFTLYRLFFLCMSLNLALLGQIRKVEFWEKLIEFYPDSA